MRLRYTPRASRQLDAVLAALATQSPRGAASVAARVSAVTNLLLRFPLVGRQTARQGVRRFMVTPYPYVIDYRVDCRDLVVLGVRHTSRKPVP